MADSNARGLMGRLSAGIATAGVALLGVVIIAVLSDELSFKDLAAVFLPVVVVYPVWLAVVDRPPIVSAFVLGSVAAASWGVSMTLLGGLAPLDVVIVVALASGITVTSALAVGKVRRDYLRTNSRFDDSSSAQSGSR